MFDSVTVIGATGRSGSAICARLRQRDIPLREHDGELMVLCVPDQAIAEVAQRIEPGPWMCHVSGATPLAALDPHEQRFSVHPLQTLVKWRGPEQLDGAFGAVTAETGDGRERGFWFAHTLGLQPFELREENRALYHAGALFELAGAPPEGLLPLMRRTIENGFELTGPIARGDWSTMDAHLAAIAERKPELGAVYRALAKATTR
jgi:predicted short-subunit dehydrogenase-like oxidoreductase (DUF2520 family)